MLENNNKKIVGKLAKRSFFKNKLRNIAAVTAIALTALLFTSIITIGIGASQSMTLTSQKQKGSKADADLRYMTAEQFQKLKESDMAEIVGERRPIGFLSNTNHHNVELDYMDAAEQELTFSVPAHGKAPQAANEIATTDKAMEDLGITPEIGAEIPIEFELRGKTYHFDMIVSGWWEAGGMPVSMMIVSEAFMKENEALFPYTYRQDLEMAGTYFSDIVLKSNIKIKDQLYSFIRSVGGEPEDREASNYILSAVNQMTNPPLNTNLVFGIAGFAVLFIVCGYLLIYNIFDISVAQDIRHYGLLRTVGSSKRQIRQMVNRQAVWLSFIGIPIGLIIGFFLGKSVLPAVMEMFANTNKGMMVEVSPNPVIFIGAALFAGITVFLSVRKPAKKASGISSLEASKYVGDGLDSKKKTSKRKNGSRITHMAWANLGRNKTRTAFIMISLLLCTVLLNSVFVIAGSFDTDKWIKSMSKTDFIIASSSTFNNMKGFVHHDDALDENMVKAVEEQPGVKEGGRLYKNTLDDRNVSFEYGCRIADTEERDGYSYGITEEGESFTLADDKRPLCNAFGISDAVLSRMTIVNGEKDLNVLREKLAKGNYIIEGVSSVRGNGDVSIKEFTSEIGQNIDAYVDGKKAKTFTVVAQAILNDVEYEVPSINTGVVQVGNDSPYFYMTQKDFETIYQNPTLLSYSFDIDPEYELQMEEFLDNYIQNENPNASYNSVRLLKEDVWKTQQVVYVIGGIIGTVMGIAGMINFINMVITSILTRRHEFAAMQSIGMTKKQLNKMMTLEGIYYALGAGILGIITSGILGVTLVRMISSNIWFMTFRLTILPSVIICGIFLGIAVVVPSLSLKIFHKGSIVEQLRETE